MKYLIGTGFYGGPAELEFAKMWMGAINKHCNPAPERIVVVGNGNASPGGTEILRETYGAFERGLVDVIYLQGNCGHCGDLLSGRKKNEFCGWTASVMATAMLAYSNECDFVYIEQDTMAFGPWIEQCYSEMGDRELAFGKRMLTAPHMSCANAIMLVKHRFIPTFVSRHLSYGSDGVIGNLTEDKTVHIERDFPDKCCRFSMGVDRERPIHFDAKVWYAQKFTPMEIEEIKRRNLV